MQKAEFQELAQRVLGRAGEDAAFREALEADPRGTVAREYGVELPADLDVEGLRGRLNSRFQVQPDGETSELTDEELDAVAGGKCVPCGQCMP